MTIDGDWAIRLLPVLSCMISLISLWFGHWKSGLLSACLCLGLGLAVGQVLWPGLILCAAFAATCARWTFLASFGGWMEWLRATSFITLSLVLMTRGSGWFPSWEYVNGYHVALDKGVFAMSVLLFARPCGTNPQLWNQRGETLKRSLLWTGMSILVLLPLAWSLGLFTWDPKQGFALWLIWGCGNLFLVAIPEEIFFRAYWQRHLGHWLSRWGASTSWAVGLIAILFGLAHIRFGIGFAFLASVAGALYGFAYARVGRIEAAVIPHYLVNLAYFGLSRTPLDGST